MLVRKKDVEDCPRKRMCIIAVVQKKARKAGKEMGMVQLDKSGRTCWAFWSDQDVWDVQDVYLERNERIFKGSAERNLHFKNISFVLMNAGRSFCGNWHNCSSSNLPVFLSKALLVHIYGFVYLYTCCLWLLLCYNSRDNDNLTK